jgi:hypothetical protein
MKASTFCHGTSGSSVWVGEINNPPPLPTVSILSLTTARTSAGDVVVLSPEEIHDRATSDDGRRPPSGIKWVLVNGGVVVDNGLVVRMDQGKALCPC